MRSLPNFCFAFVSLPWCTHCYALFPFPFRWCGACTLLHTAVKSHHFLRLSSVFLALLVSVDCVAAYLALQREPTHTGKVV